MYVDVSVNMRHDLFDTDGSGFLEHNEFFHVARRLGLHVTAEQVHLAMKDIDNKRGGQSVDFGQFASWWLGARGCTIEVTADMRHAARDHSRGGREIFLTVLCIVFFEFYPSLVSTAAEMASCQKVDYGNNIVRQLLAVDLRIDCKSEVLCCLCLVELKGLSSFL